MRSIGMDVHRSFAQVAILEGGKTTEIRIDLDHDAVVAFGQALRSDDKVVLEATGNTAATVRLLAPFVARVVIANPLRVKAIAHARLRRSAARRGSARQPISIGRSAMAVCCPTRCVD
ncbi:hypothetical protein SAMN04489859_10402 [Paracoccus alcaliphilus]|uniref:Transposase n=1 Tax=Paracoccus alcaliphilus TaxID=34002 RepID=A0A1H8MG02_9RHOB|nr:hypothetical protein SAMN04489859_10402 [Paracoccus alcaliphilus]